MLELLQYLRASSIAMLRVPSVIAVLASLLVIYPRSGSGSANFLDSQCGATRKGHSPQTLGPWTALLHENGRIVCAGSLIHTKFILTAAHCIKEGENLQVRLGEYGRVGAEQPENHFVDMAYRHRRYNKETMENDIGLMRLSRPVQYKDHIRSICIGVDPSPIYLSLIDRQFHEYTGTAWDRTNQEKYEIGDFYAINITRVSRNYCQSVRMVQDENPKFCGWNPKANESCDGPSGSALSRVMHDTIYQFGIASYKERDCQRMRTYTNVARFSEWIQRTVNFYGSPKDQKINQPVLFPTDSTKSTPVKSQLRNSQQNANSNFRKITPNNRERSQWSRV